MAKVINDAPGVKIRFRGFRGRKPSEAIFAVEQYEGGFFGITGLVGVPLTARPCSSQAARRAIGWAKKRVIEALEAA